MSPVLSDRSSTTEFHSSPDASANSLWQLVEAIPQIVWIATNTGEIRYYNQNWFSYTGLDPSKHDAWQEVIHPDDVKDAESKWLRSIETRAPVDFELRIRSQNGEYQWFLTRAIPVEHEGTTEWIGTSTNIDAQKRSQEALAFLDQASKILSSSLDYERTLERVAQLAVPRMADWCAVDILSEDRKLERLATAHVDPEKVKWALSLQDKYPVDMNAQTGVPQVLRTGQSEFYPEIPEEMLKSAAIDEEHLEIIQAIGFTSVIIVPLAARDVVFGALSFVTAEGKRHYTASDLQLAEELGRRAGLAIDNSWLYHKAQLEIAERERTEDELRKAMEQTEANEEQLRAANQAKDRFLAVLSHELRTPLTPILATVEALQGEDLPIHLRPWLGIIERNVELEARLIDDLLDLTRITKGKVEIEFEPTDVHALIREVIDIYRDELRAKDLSLVVTLKAKNPMTLGDPARLQQVFWNIIRNASKFTPSGGRILIHSENDAAKNLIRVEISDTGIGIEPEALDRIFEPFEQGESTVTRRFGGLGLGLAISKNLVELHHGSLIAMSPGRGQGSTFIIELASAESVNRATGSEKEKSVDNRLHGRTVLLVDDHIDTSLAVRLLLERQGYRVIVANSAREALSLAKAEQFDLVISDIGLPDENGLELIPKLKSIRNVPAIALSGFGTEEDIERSKAAGFNEHITKPFNLTGLRESIERVLTQS